MKKINNFAQIIIKNDSLYVFDIDETFLVFKEVSDIWWKRNFDRLYRETNDYEYASNKMNKLFLDTISKNKPKATDLVGFKELERKCKLMNSKIIFLTARPSSMVQLTLDHLKSVYPTIDSDVYFSSEKGFKLKEIIDSDKKQYENIIFVDDKIYNIKDVQKSIPQADCYQFDPREYIINYELLTN